MGTLVVHSPWLVNQFDGDLAIEFDNATAGYFKLGLYSNTSIDPDVIDYENDLTDVNDVVNTYTGPVALTSPTCALDGSNNLKFDATESNASWTQDASGFTDGRTVGIYHDTGGADTTDPVLCTSVEAATFSLADGDVSVTLDATNGIWVLTI